MKNLFTILLFLISSISFSQINLNVNEIRGLDTTGGGCADYDSAYVRTTGVVYGKNFGQSNGRIQLSLIDRRADTLLSNRCGIGLFKSNQTLPVTLNEGDSIRVIGLVTCFNGLSQINIDSVKVLKTNVQLIQPRIVQQINEISESYLVKMRNMEFISSSWPSSPSGAGFTAKAFRGIPGTTGYQEFDVRIDNDCNLFGLPIPQGKVDIVGIGGQFDSSIPRDSRYQLLPRTSQDITPAEPLVLPTIEFQDTVLVVDEGSSIVVPVISSSQVPNQISCLVISQNITTTTSDFTLQQPPTVTFPTNSTSSNFSFNCNADEESESMEEFILKLRKITNDYNIGPDSTLKIKILGTLSVGRLNYFDIYKDVLNGALSVNLPNNFIGELRVYNSYGQEIMISKGQQINQDLVKLANYPMGIYRLILFIDNKQIVKTIRN